MMKEEYIRKITNFPDNVFPISTLMHNYVVSYLGETGKMINPNTFNPLFYYEEAREYYRKCLRRGHPD